MIVSLLVSAVLMLGSEDIIKFLLKHGAYVNSACITPYWESCTPLWLAVRKGHVKVVKLLLESGANVDTQDRDGTTVLHFAVEKEQDKVVQVLLESGVNVNGQHKDGRTALHFAVEKGQEKFVQLLLECGANVDAEDKDGKTVLYSAVEKGCPVIVEHVLKRCPDVNNKSNRSALNVAVHGIDIENGKIVENLLQYGFTLSPEDVNNCKLLCVAVQGGYLKIVEELLKYGVDVNKLQKSPYGGNYMPLHFASKYKQEEVAKLLMSYGADVNAKDETGKPPIFYAIENADLKITKLLLTNKANIKDNPVLLNVTVSNGCTEIVKVLLEHGADVNTSDKCGRTALHFTAVDKRGGFFGVRRDRDPDVMGETAKLLLSRGANVNAQTEKGATTLHAACGKGYVKVVKTLLQYNANVNCTDKTDVTPLHIASHNGRIEIVKILLKFGASIDSKDKYGTTALHLASEGRHEKIVRALLKYGSDINIMGDRNRTPLDFAMADICSPFNRFYRYHFHFCNRFLSVGIHGHEIVANILKRQVIKIKTANFFVNERNLLSVGSNDELSNFQKRCEKEIASMKSEKVGNANVSFYDILTKGQLAVYAGNESIAQILRLEDYKFKFPIYAGMINCNFRRGERRKELLEPVSKIFHSLFHDFPLLPHDCTEKIFSYLSDEDLRILIGDCKPISVSSPNADINNVIITSDISEMS